MNYETIIDVRDLFFIEGRGTVVTGLAGPELAGLTEDEVREKYPLIIAIERFRTLPIEIILREKIGLLLK